MCGGMDDLAGNKTTETNAKGTMTYAYDKLNRLKTVTDAYNKVISCTVKKSDNGYTAEVTNYQYDRQNVILETDASSNITARYIRGINYIAKTDAQSSLTYFLYNGHGDVVQTVDEAGTIKNQYDYDIWGNPTLTVETTPNAIRYAGEFLDNETGLYYLRARYYDPYTGRFITEDSYWGEDENPLSLNRYTYCENDPIQYVDPTGHLSANELDWLFGKGASQLFDENGNYKDGTVPMMVEGIGIITDVACSEALDSQKYGYTFMTSDSTVYGQIDNYSSLSTINTSDNSNTTITNHDNAYIGTINTGTGSNTTINNRGIIDTINVGKNATATIYNYNQKIDPQTGEYVIGIGTIRGETDSQINVYNYGGIDEIHTGAYSNNEIDTSQGYINWLETGFHNGTKVKGKDHIEKSDGNGNIYYKLFKFGYEPKWIDSDNTKLLDIMLNTQGWSYSPTPVIMIPTRLSDGTLITADNRDDDITRNYFLRYVYKSGLGYDSDNPSTDYYGWLQDTYGKNGMEKFWEKAQNIVYNTEDPVASLQNLLDAGGMIPLFGEPLDGVNSVIYFVRGDKVNAALSAGAMVPFIGNGVTGVKIAKKGAKAVDNALDVAKTAKKLIKFKGDEAVLHFERHGKEMMDALGKSEYNLKDYINDANFVVNNGQYVSELNGYIRLVGGKGSAKYGFVGIDRATGNITTFHIKPASELAKKAPSLGITK